MNKQLNMIFPFFPPHDDAEDTSLNPNFFDELNKVDESVIKSQFVVFSDGETPIDYKSLPLFNLKKDVSLPRNQNTCEHDLKPYTGFSESYQFCSKCDHKIYK